MTSVEPSYFVRTTCRFRTWCNITVCGECGLRAKYEDCHPIDPCPDCGAEMKEHVGKWVTTVKPLFFGLLRKEQGKWVLREEEQANYIKEHYADGLLQPETAGADLLKESKNLRSKYTI